MDVFSNILENQIFFWKFCDFRKFKHRKFTAVRRPTLVQHPGQTIGPRAIKIGMHLPSGAPYGHFFENFRKSFFFSKFVIFVNLDLENARRSGGKLLYNSQAKLLGLERSKLACPFLVGLPMEVFWIILKNPNFSRHSRFS